jgi:hypothetical protein
VPGEQPPEGVVDSLREQIERQRQPHPTVGRVVHFYQQDDSDPIAAMIVKVNGDLSVNLKLFASVDDLDDWFAENVHRSEKPAKDHWSWPPRV